MLGREQVPLFSQFDGSAVLRGQVEKAATEVQSLPEDRLLNTEIDSLARYFVDKYRVEVPTLDLNNVVASEHEREVEVFDGYSRGSVLVRGTAFDFEIPFTGDAEVFRMTPNSYDSGPPQAEIRGSVVCFSVEGRELTEDAIKQQFERTRNSIQKYLEWHRDLWRTQDQQIETAVRSAIEQRRERLLKQKALAAGLSSLGIKLKEKPNDPRTYVPPTVKQRLAVQLPPMKEAKPPDPTLDQGQYEAILTLLRGAGRSIEQSSSRTRALDEEALRDMLLVPLNAHFGQATGETFNLTGKTDILVRHEAGNLFVAECKIWGGDQHFLATIDQLLAYLTWRDTKTALIIFNRNVRFSQVVDKIQNLPPKHASFVSGPVRLDDSSFRFTLKLPQDHERHVTTTVLAFDLGAAT